ncbi:HAD family hydrolase [Actibacterium lipolyticum]|uniref:phosphoglycolate phosphatase n=1 Tax=Actibacterium lipolyticum TaxID=1524263 RepID=A0A238JRA1_9RHOB|nr:HAD family hydrolase [Actibacterium lipolyticum]SMX33170.1 Phosphoglycolate phosphatase [Actibacterium lipolyticum]
MTVIGGILFDKDGTLFDFHATWGAWASGFLAELSGGDQYQAIKLGAAIGYDYAGERFEIDSPVIAGTPAEIAGQLLPLLPGTTPAALITRMNAAAANAPMREATALMPLLNLLASQGLKLGVATNDAEGPARAHLDGVGVTDMFDFIAGCDSGHGAKPGPGQLLAFADTMGLAPQHVLMVGDSRHDLVAGRAAGMGTVGVLTGLATASDLDDLADVVLPDIGHIPAYLMAKAA